MSFSFPKYIAYSFKISNVTDFMQNFVFLFSQKNKSVLRTLSRSSFFHSTSFVLRASGAVFPIEIRVSKSGSQLRGWQLAQNRLGFVQVIYCFHFLYCETESAKCSSISVIFLLSSKQIFCRFSEFSACADTSSVVADRLDIWSTIFALLSCKFTQSL